jgi:glucokinase
MSTFPERVLLGDIGATNARFALVTTRMPRTRRRLRRADLQPIELTRTLR